MIKYFIIFAFVMGMIYLAVFGIQSAILQHMIKTDEDRQLTLVEGRSKETMTEVTEENLKALIKWAADRTDDEFWIAAHDLKMLQNQVADIYAHPGRYGKTDRAGRLANLAPMLREFLLKSEFNVDIGVATMEGPALNMDRLSEDGSVISTDVTDRVWYKGAIERGDIFFYPIHNMSYEFDEIAYAAPVYAEGEVVAVIKGSVRTDILKGFLEGRDLGKSGFTVLVSDKGQLVYSPRISGELKIEDDLSLDIRSRVNDGLKEAINKGLAGQTGVSRITVDGEDYYAAYGYVRSCKWAQVIFVSAEEVLAPTNELLTKMKDVSEKITAQQDEENMRSTAIAVAVLAVIMVISVVMVSRTARKRARPLAAMAERVSNISAENISFGMEDLYKTGDEIQVLAESFEELSGRMEKYLREIVSIMSEKERVKTELSLATRIQSDMLPSKFPAFPDHREFDIYASMTPAKEVGGDFYDFFFAGEDKLAMVMADVSGKGVPAAMFMMMAKTMIQSQLVAQFDARKVLEDVNNIICSNNREKMFVTVWLGVLDLATGVLTASNAGHEYPIFKEPDGPFEIIKDKHGFVIGGKKNMKYTNYELHMKPGSKLFVYTDGVPEAMDKDRNLFGMERTLSAVNEVALQDPKTILENVDKRVSDFVGPAEQFDDLTMMCIEFFGKGETR